MCGAQNPPRPAYPADSASWEGGDLPFESPIRETLSDSSAKVFPRPEHGLGIHGSTPPSWELALYVPVMPFRGWECQRQRRLFQRMK